MSAPIITTDGLTKRFGAFTAVEDVALRVEPGTIFAFLGANGSGKSTTIRMLIGLLRPTSGTAVVDGIDVVHHPRRVRDHIGYMGQHVSLYQGLTVRENVEFYGGLHGLDRPRLERRWGTLAERFGLAEAAGARSEEIPAAIRQRAGLALSMLHEPRLLFLDEPTAGVDVRSRSLFWEVIGEEARRGVSVFVTTHFLEEVDACDRVSFIEAGRIIAEGTPDDLRRRCAAPYRIEVEAPAREVARLQDAAAAAGLPTTSTDGGLRALVPALDPAYLHALQALADAEPALRIHVREPPMGEVFERLLGAAGKVAQ